MQIPLCLDNIGELDHGAARLIIDAAIRDALRDLDDRGKDGKPRDINIKISMSLMDNGLIATHVEANSKIPARRTASTLGLVKQAQGNPEMLFQTLSPGDPHQTTIDQHGG